MLFCLTKKLHLLSNTRVITKSRKSPPVLWTTKYCPKKKKILNKSVLFSFLDSIRSSKEQEATFSSLLLHVYCTTDAIFNQAKQHQQLDQPSPMSSSGSVRLPSECKLYLI